MAGEPADLPDLPITAAPYRGGYDRLWGWFGLSYASFIVIPRILAHEMPNDWQARMAKLLEEYDEAFPGVYSEEMPSPMVTARKRRSFCKWPDWLLNYRYPDHAQIERLRRRG